MPAALEDVPAGGPQLGEVTGPDIQARTDNSTKVT
jgi:hypothetical protein